MKDVFLLGAGFSRAVAAEMPLLADLSTAVSQKLPEVEESIKSFAGNIEMVMTYLSQDHPWLSEAENLRNRALFLDISSAIRDVLVESMRKAAERPCPDWLLALIHYWESTDSRILTLNYDTLVESAARLCKDVYKAGLKPDRYYPFSMVPLHRQWEEFTLYSGSSDPPSFKMFKLHGSINWLFSGSKSSSGETIYYAGQDDVWGPKWSTQFREIGTTDKTPLIVPPVAEKSGYFQHPHVRGTWREAASALRQARRIFCLGYSLPELDTTMRFFLLKNYPAERVPFFVVDICNLLPRFCEMLPAENYEPDGCYVRLDDPIPHFVQALV